MAWVNYLAVRGVFGKLTERLAQSIHRFSKHPLIVLNFGKEARVRISENIGPLGLIQAPELSPERFPHLVPGA